MVNSCGSVLLASLCLPQIGANNDLDTLIVITGTGFTGGMAVPLRRLQAYATAASIAHSLRSIKFGCDVFLRGGTPRPPSRG